MADPTGRTRFPGSGTGSVARYGALELRGFGGEPSDLDLDLETRARGADTAIELLAACACVPSGGRIDAADLWALPIGLRLEALLRLAVLGGDPRAQVTQRCDACQEVMESEFSLLELAEVGAARAAIPIEIRHAGHRLRLRRPTGADVRRWSEVGADELTMLADLCESLPADARLDASWLAVADDAMNELDPLVDFSIATTCPECETPCDTPVDLEVLALGRLRAMQRGLLDTVHRLALAYHWTEAEILGLPPWRRARYVELVERAWR